MAADNGVPRWFPGPGHIETGFEYASLKLDPLKPAPPEIRLLTLRPGVGSDPIECTVQICSFDVDLHDTYDALSYAWGNKDEQKSITVGNNSEFKIRKNLWLALNRIRHATEERKLWVDAVCINQSSPEEKGEQLGNIEGIYRKCKTCIIWLGQSPSLVTAPDPLAPVSDGGAPSQTPSAAALALEVLKMFGSCSPKRTAQEQAVLEQAVPEQAVKHLYELDCFVVSSGSRTDVRDSHKAHFEALAALLELEWWKRTWVIQELALPATIQLFFAGAELPYELLKAAVDGLAHHSSMDCCKDHRLGLRGLGFDTIVTIEERIASMVFVREQKSTVTFTQLRRRFCGSQVSWKRDSFYGFLGIVTNKSFLRPSYGLSLRTAISQATYDCVKHEPDGVELLLGERLFRSRAPYVRFHVPSWVSDACFCTFPPKWALVERRRLAMYESFAVRPDERKDFVKNLQMSKNGILVTESRRVGKVEELGDVFVDKDQWSHVPTVLLSWMKMAGIDPSSWPAGLEGCDETQNTFWRTIINDSDEEDGASLRYGRPDTSGGRTAYSRLVGLLAVVVRQWLSTNYTLGNGTAHSRPEEPVATFLSAAWEAVSAIARGDMAELGPEGPLATAARGILSFISGGDMAKLGLEGPTATVARWILSVIDGGDMAKLWLGGLLQGIGRLLLDDGAEEIGDQRNQLDPPTLHDLAVSHDPKMVYHLLACLWERRLFKTDDERIGLSPRDTEKGDEVHIIPGCPAPFILRRLDEPESLETCFELGDWETDRMPQYMVVGNGFFLGGQTGVGAGSKPETRKIAIH